MDNKMETIMELCNTHLAAGNSYMQMLDYKSAIQEFTKVIELLPQYIDLAVEFNKGSAPLDLKNLNVENIKNNAQIAYMGRAMSYHTRRKTPCFRYGDISRNSLLTN